MGLAAPYAASLRSPLPMPVAIGLVFAAGPFGTAIGAVVTGRLIPEALRRWLMGPLAIGSCLLLLLCWLHLDLIGALLVIAGSGACASYQLAANSAFVAAVPQRRRGQAFGLANGGMQVIQGLWIVLAGAAVSSSAITPAVAVAISGGLGAIIAAVLAWRQHRAARCGEKIRSR
jgi:MFS family permease